MGSGGAGGIYQAFNLQVIQIDSKIGIKKKVIFNSNYFRATA